MPPVIEPAQASTSEIDRLLQLRAQRVPSSDIVRLRRIYDDAVSMYGQQMDWSGESLIDHCLGVLALYLPFDPDDTGVAACLLHHALDTKLWTIDDLERSYGPEIRSIVSAVHLLSRVVTHERRMTIDELRLMFLRMSDDMRTVVLILCDCLRKLEVMTRIPPELRRRLCRDVLQLFAPAAARLGVYALKQRLESRAFPAVYPTDAVRIAEQMEDLQTQHGDFLPRVAELLTQQLAEQGIQARIEGRQKQPYSIFQKMDGKSVTHVQDLFDLYALRVIVSDEAACYQTLGVLHRIAHPVAHRFKDYIGFPKPNGYRSLHTTLAKLPGVPDGIVVEVQIRTDQMQREAELGVAAHWSYKEGADAYDAARRAELQATLLRQTSGEHKEHASLSDHIFVLTPAGDVIELPGGATPLDFAFSVHTMLGLCFKGAKVNGGIVPVNHHLENGDMVEIIRRNEPKPSYNWLSILRTSSARSKLKRHLALVDREGLMQIGKEAMNAELLRRGLPSLDPDLTVLRTHDGSTLTQSEREDLLVQIGRRSQNPSSLLRHLDVIRRQAIKEELPMQIAEIGRTVVFRDGIDMPIRFARCCKPDEGRVSAIAGVATRDGTVRVHRYGCAMIRNINPGRWVDVQWGEKRT